MNDTLRNTLPLMHLLVLVTHIINGGKANAMLHKGLGDGSNSQLMLKWPRYYIFFNNSRAKEFLNLAVSEALISHVTNGGKASAM